MSVHSTPSIDKKTTPRRQRLGFHYFPDTLHYREADLQAWLPELTGLGVAWLVLRSETERAIPERFLRALKSAGIEPLIQFDLPLDRPPDPREQARDLASLLEVYARWGARYVLFFDRPNAQASWSASAWAQQDLVERFLDRFLPLAELAQRAGLTPLFPPLEPGGSYWDTAFLRSALQGLQRRKQENVLRNLVLTAYAWSNGRSLDWGGGGPERWPEARPYYQAEDSQDQRGFRIFEWYLAVARSVLERECPIMLLQAALPDDAGALAGKVVQTASHAADCLAVVRLLAGETVQDPMDDSNTLDPIPALVIGCNFWLLSASNDDPYAGHAWFPEKASAAPAASVAQPAAVNPQPAADNPQPAAVNPQPAEGEAVPATLETAQADPQPEPVEAPAAVPAGEPACGPVAVTGGAVEGESQSPVHETTAGEAPVSEAARALRGWRFDHPVVLNPGASEPVANAAPAIRHYLLLPGYEWGVSDWYLEIIRPFVKKYRPTIGFSVEEAARAAHVTIVGNAQNYPEDTLIRLRLAGCAVEQISGDGARIATLLSER